MRDAGDPTGPWAAATEIAAAVNCGEVTARAVAEAALARIAAADPAINAFTDVLAERALRTATAVDARRAAGARAEPLAGVPFAVKNLFDVAGLATRAGARINRDRRAAASDAVLVKWLEAAGAVLTGALNMGEYAYDFTGENAHDGRCGNPHAPDRMTGGSSSGSAAATAAGLAPISLGSDTNGSLRVPAALCGVFSLKPTYGRLPRTGTFPFVDSLDHLGPFARTVGDLAAAYDAMQGHDAGDHGCVRRPPDPAGPTLGSGVEGLRIGIPTGWFAASARADALAAVDALAETVAGLGTSVRSVCLDDAAAGRAAAYLITNAESAAFHLPRLRTRAGDFDPDTRARFLAGAMLPAAWVTRAQQVRRWWLERALAAFADVDLLLVPATPCRAPAAGAKTLELAGREVPLRPSLGLLSQPFSCIGLPVVTVPLFAKGELPLGVQIVAPPWQEARALRLAAVAERTGVAIAHPPPGLG